MPSLGRDRIEKNQNLIYIQLGGVFSSCVNDKIGGQKERDKYQKLGSGFYWKKVKTFRLLASKIFFFGKKSGTLAWAEIDINSGNCLLNSNMCESWGSA